MDKELGHHHVQARRAMAQTMSAMVQERKESEDILHLGRKGLKGFRQYLKEQFGSILAGWRALDPQNNGRLSWEEFAGACRGLGFHGNMKTLWTELDTTGTGFISVMELHPRVGEMVGAFKLHLLKEYGDMLTAWQQGLDPKGTGCIHEEEVTECVKNLGLPMDGKELYIMLKASIAPGSAGLTLKGFDPDAHKRYVTSAHDHAGAAWHYRDPLVRDAMEAFELDGVPEEALQSPKFGRAKMWRLEVEKKEIDAHMENFQSWHFPLGLDSADALRQALRARFGSLYCGWREGLDPDGKGRLTMEEFCKAFRNLGGHGEVNKLWASFDWRRRGYVTFEDLDPTFAPVLEDFRSKLCEKHGNMMLAWLHGLDPKNTLRCTEESFIKNCEEIGFTNNAKKLFKALMPPGGRTYLTLADLDTQAAVKLQRGDFLMLTEAEEKKRSKGKGRLEMNINERTDASYFFQSYRARNKAKTKEYAEKCRMEDWREKNPTTEGFRKLCVRHYGSMVGAWRQFLDRETKGRLAFTQFVTVVRAIGYAGDVKALWIACDRDRNGYVSLHELDPKADKIIRDFVTLVRDKFPDLQAAWRCMGKDPSGYMDVEDLKKGCKAIGYPHNPYQLFACLQTEKLKPYCTMWDAHSLYICPVYYGVPGEAVGLMSRAIMQSAPCLALGSTRGGSRAGVAADSSTSKTPRGGTTAEMSKISGTLATTSTSPMPTVLDDPQIEEALHTFKNQLIREYGSTAAGWRIALDPKHKNSVQFGNFKLACESCSWSGKMAGLWQRLAAGRTWFCYRDLDPEPQELIDEARTRLLERYGTLKDVWEKGLDPEGAGHCDKRQFLEALKTANIEFTEPKRVFELMLIRLGQRSLQIDDMQALLVGVPHKQRQKMWGYFDRKEEPIERKEMKELLPIPREVVEKHLDAHHSQDFVISTVEGFKHMLLHKFGSVLNAWNTFLDPDHNGIMSFQDFAAACMHLGIRKCKSLWADLDLEFIGQLTLRDLDAEIADLLLEFEGLLVGHYGHVKKGWFAKFDTDRASHVSREAFIAGCKDISFTGDAGKLFDSIRPDRGYPFLKYEDIWFDHNRNDYDFQKSYKAEHLDFRSPLGTSYKHFKHRSKKTWDAHVERKKAEEPPPAEPAPEAEEEEPAPEEPIRTFMVVTEGEGFEVQEPGWATLADLKAHLHQQWQFVSKLSICEDDSRYDLPDDMVLWNLVEGTALFCTADAIGELEARIGELEGPGTSKYRRLAWLDGVPGSDPRFLDTLWVFSIMAGSVDAARYLPEEDKVAEHFVDQVSAMVLLALEAIWDPRRATNVPGWENRVVLMERGARCDARFVDAMYHQVGVWPWELFKNSLAPHYNPLAHARLLEWVLAGVTEGMRSPHFAAALADFTQLNEREGGPIHFIMAKNDGDRLSDAFENLMKFACADDEVSDFAVVGDGMR